MSFHLTAQDIRIDENRVLAGQLQNNDGEYIDATIDLNQFLGNDNGSFKWEGENFSETAQNVEFHIEGDGEVPVLRAELSNLDGEYVPADINLSERVVNENGAFVFV